MKTIERKSRTNRIRANAGEDLGLLVNLLRQNKIGYKMLLRNLVEIVNDDFELVVQAVSILSNKAKRNAVQPTQLEFQDTLVGLRCADHFNGKEILIASVSDAMQVEW